MGDLMVERRPLNPSVGMALARGTRVQADVILAVSPFAEQRRALSNSQRSFDRYC